MVEFYPQSPPQQSDSPPDPAGKVDWREALVNEGAVGPIQQVQVSEVEITCLRGIMIDVDPGILRPSAVGEDASTDPVALFENVIRSMLDRNPVLARAEVRMSGGGLHVLVWFREPVQFRTERDRLKWASVVRLVQRMLPSDPDAPGITATTRPVGSINGKNDATVRILRAGEAVEPEKVLAAVQEFRDAPFQFLARILFGDRLAPCPICEKPESRLGVMPASGKCYGHCGKVKVEQLYSKFLAPRTRKGVSHA